MKVSAASFRVFLVASLASSHAASFTLPSARHVSSFRMRNPTTGRRSQQSTPSTVLQEKKNDKKGRDPIFNIFPKFDYKTDAATRKSLGIEDDYTEEDDVNQKPYWSETSGKPIPNWSPPEPSPPKEAPPASALQAEAVEEEKKETPKKEREVTMQPTITITPEQQEEVTKKATEMVNQVVSPLFSQDIEKGVPLSTIQTVSITSALLTLMATKDLTFAALALLGMALVTITPGPIGITCRTVGDLIFTTVTSFWKLSEKLGVKDAVSNRLAKMDYTNKMDRIRRVETEVQTILQQAEETLQGADSEMVEIQKFQTDVQDVLKEADSAISSAIQIQEDKMRLAAEEAKVLKLTQKAEKADEKMREVAETASRLADETARVAAEVAAKKAEEPIVDISIPYDAPARNAYEASGKKGDFKAFKADYEAAAVAGVISKKEAKEADAARVAEEARVAEKARVAEEERLAEETRLAEEARLAEEERLAEEARVAEEERLAKEARLAEEAELAEEARLAEEQRVAEEARLAEEQKQADEDEAARLAATDPDVEEGDFSDMDWDTSVEMAKDSMDGTIVGIDDVDVDDSEKAEWDAAKVFAKSLNEGQKEPPLVFDDETPAVEPEEIDMEALARAAREAVEKFEQQQLVDEEVSDDGDAFTPVFDDEASMEDIAEAARKAAEMYNSDLVDDDDQEDIFFDDIDEDEDVAAESTPPVQIQDWSTLKVVDLKAELGARGLTPKGKKADLVAMLVDSDAERLLAASESPAPTTDNSGADEEFDFSDMDLEEIGRAAREAAELFDGEEPSDEVLMMLENEEVDLLEPEPVEETPAKGKAAPSDYSSMNVAALKDELRSRGLKVSGRKQELIARLQSSD